MTVLLGFDPGGDTRFGWCVCDQSEGLPLAVRQAGRASTVKDALEQAVANLREGEEVLGSGIDAPLFWVPTGPRAVDVAVRSAVRTAGAPHPSGTVQHVNSLRGACVVQGMLLAVLLRDLFPNITISEAHPKALLWILGMLQRNAPLESYVDGFGYRAEHERDAAVSCLNAWAAVRRPEIWQDLSFLDPKRYSPAAPVSYWMPRWNNREQ